MGTENRLSREKSPYLLKHASNPVGWYPWGEEAMARSKNDGKPIFLSIGYSTCHWCTVMERESFEDEKTAAFLNKHFIPVKVDREERPEVDAYYMGAVQAMTGGGGWPLSVFITPDLKPFFGGTYYPPEPRQGMPSFMQVLEFVARLWKEKREEVVADSERVAATITRGRDASSQELARSPLDEGCTSLLASFDPEHGGVGRAPKFPLPGSLSFLLRYWYRTGKGLALSAVEKTLDEMAAGGIRDHVGGGFHRYSTDRYWLVPHFEKMLYDNALLARVYVDGYLVTRKPAYEEVARDTVRWIMDEMRHPEGGFYSAQDADTGDGEGAYYTWTPEEVAAALGRSEGERFCRAFGVTRTGNFDGRSILHLDPARAAGGEELEREAQWKRTLYSARVKREGPATDTKVLTSWNGLAVSSLAYAGAALGEEGFVKAAAEAADFVLRTNSKGGRLLRRFAGGEAALGGTLEDYAYFVNGLVDLFQADPQPKWLREGTRLADIMVSDFGDEKDGGFYLTVEGKPARLKETYDGPTPSGSAMAALALVRLSELTGDERFRSRAEGALKSFGREVQQEPASHTCALAALDLCVNGGTEVVISVPTAESAGEFAAVAFSRYAPDRSVVVATPQTFDELSRATSLLEGRRPTGSPRAFVCQGFACKLPADSAETLASQLAGR